MGRAYICIDLKSFYASVECVERNLDPFITNLVVADPERSKSTICLAITPAMKKLGVKNRCRIHEIPEYISYITAMPRMQLYIDYSARIYSIYLSFVAAEDIHVYSIDECFIDVTDYLKLYGTTAKELAGRMMNAVYEQTGITATAGVGSNLYLAKIAMDIVAKHVRDNIGVLDEMSYRKRMWTHMPLTDFWRIGPGTARSLEGYGAYTMGDVADMSLHCEDILYKKFGVDAELLIDHAWGYEPCTMKDIKNYHPSVQCLSSGQVLMRNYDPEEGIVIVKEMTDFLVMDMVEKKLMTDSVTLYLSYDHKSGETGSVGSVNLIYATGSSKRILGEIEKLYWNIVKRQGQLRRINITFNHVVKAEYFQYDLFRDIEEVEKEKSLQESILDIRKRYGKNAILRGCNLYECSNAVERNRQIGGHKA